MKISMSEYEYRQVSNFIDEVYFIWGRRLNKTECRGECWIVYFEGKRQYQYNITSEEYWDYILLKIKERLKEMKRIKNERIRLESRMSLNCKYGECKEEIMTIIPNRSGDFVNGIALWDYSKSLGKIKYAILRLMNAGEGDLEIINILGVPECEYYGYKAELRSDFERYLNI